MGPEVRGSIEAVALSPDGRRIAFDRGPLRQRDIYSRVWDGSSPARLIRAPADGALIFEGEWTLDGQSIVYRELLGTGVGHVFQASSEPGATPEPILQNDFFNVALSLSPDGDKDGIRVAGRE